MPNRCDYDFEYVKAQMDRARKQREELHLINKRLRFDELFAACEEEDKDLDGRRKRRSDYGKKRQ